MKSKQTQSIITVRVPDELYAWVARSAQKSIRSLNGQVVALLTEAMLLDGKPEPVGAGGKR